MLGTDLFDVCEQLQRDSGARKVMVCSADGEVLAHVGDAGTLDDASAEAVAALVGEVIQGAQREASGEDRIGKLAIGGLQVCAAPVAAQGALVVLFDENTSLERVRAKMRRARTLLGKNLMTEKGPTAS